MFEGICHGRDDCSDLFLYIHGLFSSFCFPKFPIFSRHTAVLWCGDSLWLLPVLCWELQVPRLSGDEDPAVLDPTDFVGCSCSCAQHPVAVSSVPSTDPPAHTALSEIITDWIKEWRKEVVAFELQIFLYVWGISNTQTAKSRVGKSNLVHICIKILEVGRVVV